MMYLLLFHLLFGTYVSRHFTYMPSYYFSRISNRKSWFGKKFRTLMFYAGGYLIWYLGATFLGCCLISSGKADDQAWRCLGIMFGICYFLLILSTLLINISIILWKSGIGFLLCWMGILTGIAAAGARFFLSHYDITLREVD
jgi:hypothetical protein